MVFRCKATFDLIVLGWSYPDTNILFVVKDFRAEPANLINLRDIDEENINFGAAVTFTAFTQTKRYRSSALSNFTIGVFYLCSIQLASPINDEIIATKLPNRFGNDGAYLHSLQFNLQLRY
jgi:hypothetical protein